ncbi:MAG: hypothetical protein ACOX63_10200 [Christensenellales bacterium]|jgi:hypothetical protein
MTNDKLVIKKDVRPPSSKSLQVRVAADHYARISKAATSCGMTNREMTDCLLGFALSRLVMEPVPLYRPAFQDKGEDVIVMPGGQEDTDED